MLLGITGMSAAGKTHVISNLPEMDFAMAVSCTTRPIRKGELEGFDYHFLSDDQFARQCADGLFLEHDQFAGYQYGLGKDEIESALNRAPCAVHVCTPSGITALEVQAGKLGIPFCSVFIQAPIQTVIYRLLRRWADNPDMDRDYLANRIAHSVILEQGWSGHFNYVVPTSNGFIDVLQELQDLITGNAVLPSPVELKSSAPLALSYMPLIRSVVAAQLHRLRPPVTREDLNDLNSAVSSAICITLLEQNPINHPMLSWAEGA